MRTPKPFSWASRRSTVTCPWTCCISTIAHDPGAKVAAHLGRQRCDDLLAVRCHPALAAEADDLRRQDQILHGEGLEAAASRARRGLDDQGALRRSPAGCAGHSAVCAAAGAPPWSWPACPARSPCPCRPVPASVSSADPSAGRSPPAAAGSPLPMPTREPAAGPPASSARRETGRPDLEAAALTCR